MFTKTDLKNGGVKENYIDDIMSIVPEYWTKFDDENVLMDNLKIDYIDAFDPKSIRQSVYMEALEKASKRNDLKEFRRIKKMMIENK